jgi:hypothetical protein
VLKDRIAQTDVVFGGAAVVSPELLHRHPLPPLCDERGLLRMPVEVGMWHDYDPTHIGVVKAVRKFALCAGQTTYPAQAHTFP